MTEKKMTDVGILNDLIEYVKDAEIAFQEASRDVRKDDYRKMFTGYAGRMNEFASDLKERIVRMGGKPRQTPGKTGEVRRVWMHFRSVLNLHHTKPVLLECEKEEESLLDHYQKAVQADLPPETQEAVEKQMVEVIEMRDHLKELEEVVPN